MIIVVTGMVGIDKNSYLRRVCQFAKSNGKEVLLCNVGDMMYSEARDIKPGKILDIPLKRLSSLRRSVFKDIIAKSKRAENVIVNTHATFRWRHGLFPAVDFDQMRELAADKYVCMIDSVVAMHGRLSDDHSIEHTLKDLMVWRDEEIIATELLYKGIDESRPFICLSRGVQEETVETFYRLVFEEDRKKAYLSFPMSHVMEMEDVLRDIDGFRKTMNGVFTCFDPADLEEADLPWRAEQAEARGEKEIVCDEGGKQVRVSTEQVRQIKRDINSQIYTRDFLLIDQADMIISYIPALADGRAAISSGVERELQHAHEAAKETYVIWRSKDRPSVFVTQTATKVFSDAEAAIAFFKQKGYIKNDNRK
jgi:adenylate kinase